MSLSRPDSEMTLWSEGNVTTTLDRTGPTTATISWTLPRTMNAYDGAIVLLHTSELKQSNLPKDQQRYSASANFAVPLSDIDGAFVVGAFYGDKLTNSVDIIGLTADTVYYASVHAVSNTLEYYTPGALSYVAETKTDGTTGDIPQSSCEYRPGEG